MRRRFMAFSLLSLCLAALPLRAQQAAPEAGFDFLLGEWSLDVQVKVSGLAALIHGQPQLGGSLKAWRTADGIVDELTVLDASANPRSSTRSQRRFDAAAGRWSITTSDAYHARQGTDSGRWEDGEMRVDGSYAGSNGTVLTRSRYFAIGSDSFRLRQDRSSDGGVTWDEAAFAYTARRTAAARP